MKYVRRAVSLVLGVASLLSTAAPDLAWQSTGDSDLTSFVSRPEIKAPRFNVTVNENNRHLLSPGYWFTAPYAYIGQQTQAWRYYQACQTGPAIYDNDGELVWSGACMVRNQNNCDFRAWAFNGTFYLSTILYAYYGIGDKKGRGVIMDSSYNIVKNLTVAPELTIWNMHELHLSENGNRARYMTWKNTHADLRALNMAGVESGFIGDIGFVDKDLVTNKNHFEWWAEGSGEVSVAESLDSPNNLQGPYPAAWDFMHANSVDLNSEGDYLVSGRYTDTIYKISGKTGKVVWRLGGFHSTYDIQDFHFSRQHDARTLVLNETTEIISFLDNASDDKVKIANVSSAKIVVLDRTTMKANLLQSIERPDGNLTRLRGNYQILPDGNHFICWSDNSYVSEHTPEGELIMEAKWASTRFVTYRAYKFEFVGRPTEPPALVAKSHGLAPEHSVTAIYVSWNGATEVKSWRFYGASTLHGHETDVKFEVIGEKAKTGFETLFYTNKFYTQIYAEGLDKDGKVLGESLTQTVSVPDEWQGFDQLKTHSHASHSAEAGGVVGALDAYGERFTSSFGNRQSSIFVSVVSLMAVALLLRGTIMYCSRRRLKRSCLLKDRWLG